MPTPPFPDTAAEKVRSLTKIFSREQSEPSKDNPSAPPACGEGHERKMKAEGIHSGKRSGRDDEGDLRPWQNASSRIIRVSRVSGGKDRHSKVWTVKGLRDRRVRLSVSTAIQFYDLQDRLGYDQPSKAVDWLIQAAADAIVELPELAGPFPLPPSVELPARYLQRGAAGEQHQHHLSQPKPACSSASETSKGSVLSFSRCEGVGKEKDQDQDQDQNTGKQSSFTELLAVGGSAAAAEEVDFGGGFDGKQMRHHPQVNSAADCFRQGGMFGQANRIPQFETGCSSLLHFGNSSIHPHMGIGMMAYNTGEHQDMQQFSFVQDHAIPVAALAPAGGDYNVNVSVSSGFAGFSRGTLQSNSPHQHQLVHGANLPFFLSATVPISAAAGGSLENQFPGGFNGRLQLCCNEAHRHPELKGERKG